MNEATLRLLIPIISSLAGLIFDMAKNWNKADYKPIVPEDLQNSIERLQALPDLPE